MFKKNVSVEKTEWLDTSKGGYDLEFVHKTKTLHCNSGSLQGERKKNPNHDSLSSNKRGQCTLKRSNFIN